MSEKYLKEIAKEMKLIRKELEQMNGVQFTVDGPKINLKGLNRELNEINEKESVMKGW